MSKAGRGDSVAAWDCGMIGGFCSVFEASGERDRIHDRNHVGRWGCLGVRFRGAWLEVPRETSSDLQRKIDEMWSASLGRCSVREERAKEDVLFMDSACTE